MQLSLREFFKPTTPIETKNLKIHSYSLISLALNLIDYLDDYETHYYNNRHFPTNEETACLQKMGEFCEAFCLTVSKIEKVRKSAYCFEIGGIITEYIDSLNLNGLQKMVLLTEAIVELSDSVQKSQIKKIKNIPSHCATLLVKHLTDRGHRVSTQERLTLVSKVKSCAKVNYNRYSNELP